MNFPITICDNKEIADKLGRAILRCIDFRHMFSYGSLVYNEITGIEHRAGQWAIYFNPGIEDIEYDTLKKIHYFVKGFFAAIG